MNARIERMKESSFGFNFMKKKLKNYELKLAHAMHAQCACCTEYSPSIDSIG